MKLIWSPETASKAYIDTVKSVKLISLPFMFSKFKSSLVKQKRRKRIFFHEESFVKSFNMHFSKIKSSKFDSISHKSDSRWKNLILAPFFYIP